MKLRTLWASLTLAAMLAFPMLACNKDSKAGVDINNSFETAVMDVETGIFEYPAAGAGADTAVAETAIGLLGPGPQAVPLGSIWIHPSAALVANNSNYATISVFKRTAGGSAVLLGSVTTQITGSGNWAAWTPFKLSLVAGAFLSPGDSITYSLTQTGTGAPAIAQFYLAGFTTLN